MVLCASLLLLAETRRDVSGDKQKIPTSSSQASLFPLLYASLYIFLLSSSCISKVFSHSTHLEQFAYLANSQKKEIKDYSRKLNGF
jgi:hypothetical protein